MSEPASGGVSKLTAAKQALRRVVRDAPGAAKIGLRVYGATVFSADRSPRAACTDSQLVVQPGTGNRAELLRAVAGYRAFGETPTAYALTQAAKDLGPESGSILLVSDGVANCQPDPCVAAERLDKRGVDLRVNVVGLGVSGQARRQLSCIADATGGSYFDARDADGIARGLAESARRGLRPFQVVGRRVEGGDSAATAPTLEPGRYVDRLPAAPSDETVTYRVQRAIPGSTLHFSIYRSADLGIEHLRLESGPSDEACDETLTSSTYSGTSMVVGSVKAPPKDAFGWECAPGQSVLFRVQRSGLSERPAADFGITVTEEPPVSGLGDLPPPVSDPRYRRPQVDGAVSRVPGGTSLTSAPRLSTGQFASTLVPGETLVYRVPLAWGQAAAVRIDADAPDGTYVDFAAKFHDPLLAELEEYAEGSNEFGNTQSAPVRLATPEVRYRNRFQEWGMDASTAGDYYLFVTADEALSPANQGLILPVRLDVEVRGKARPGPTYVEAPQEPPASPAPSTRPPQEAPDEPSLSSAARPNPTDEAGDDSALPLVIVGAGVLLMLVLGGTALLLVRRRA